MTDPLITAAQFLTGQLDWLRHARDDQGQAVAVDVFREIAECASRMRATVEGPRASKYLGPCGAPTWCDVSTFGEPPGTTLIEGAPCDGDVYGQPGAEKGRCKTCGATVDQDERREWLDDVRREWLYHASEIAEAYPIPVNTIRTWLARGQLTAHGEHDGRPLLKLGEVLDLAAESAARREEARAQRARRREAAEMGA